MNSIAEEAIRRFEPVADAQRVRVVLIPSPLVSARVTHGHMNLVFTNLLDNAIKFSPVGGHVTVALASEASEVFVSVSDMGPGIEPEELPHIFERFYRGANARAREVPGTGLGLAVSQAIIRAYGGSDRGLEAQRRRRAVHGAIAGGGGSVTAYRAGGDWP